MCRFSAELYAEDLLEAEATFEVAAAFALAEEELEESELARLPVQSINTKEIPRMTSDDLCFKLRLLIELRSRQLRTGEEIITGVEVILEVNY